MRIGQHGKITRQYLGGGIWLARCKFRDVDGVTRRVERRGPADEFDKHGKRAEDALIEALRDRQAPNDANQVDLDTKITLLVDRYLDRLSEDGRSPVTLSTYRFAVRKLSKFIAGVRVGESTPARIDAALRSMRTTHGPTMARQSKTILKGALQLAVMANVLATNPVRDVQPIPLKARPKSAPTLTGDEVRQLLANVRASEYCQEKDLVDPITIYVATGMRPAELLGLRWDDFDVAAATLTLTGNVIRVPGEGLRRKENLKTAASRRTMRLPTFAVQTLLERRRKPYLGEQEIIFPSMAGGTFRDANNYSKQWRKVRDDLGFPDVVSTSFRRTLATLIDDARGYRHGLAPTSSATPKCQ
ncbi:MAG: tyrosine recombinase XerC [Actinomycetota bacterium]